MTDKVKSIFQTGPVIPVLAIKNLEDAVPLAHALVKGGVKVLEVTLRTPIALQALREISKNVDGAIVGVGTITGAEDLKSAADAGAKFAISPGLTPQLAQASQLYQDTMPLIPGVATASELMYAAESGFQTLKFFPAQASGGIAMLKSLAGPFADISFCPTGGITAQSAPEFLALSNVLCVGGSWLAPTDTVSAKDWNAITALAKAASKLS